MKTSRKDLDKATAVPPPYDSFFSFPTAKGGYSGVAVYVDPRSGALAHKAEEGLTGTLQPKSGPPLRPEERVLDVYPSMEEVTRVLEDLDEDTARPGDTDASMLDASATPPFIADSPPPPTLQALDAEGRTLVLDFGLFVLINTYCPNDASDTRLVYKMHYHALLQLRVQALIDAGREVIVLGDINVVVGLLDHAEWAHKAKRRGIGMEGEDELSGFLDGAPHRSWMRRWIASGGGPMHDVVREAWPDREGMYTCWNTKLSARDTNYGARIDYILCTRGLLPWIKAAGIEASIRGSDHCPVWVELHDEIEVDAEDGKKKLLKLKDEMLRGRSEGEATTARIAAKFWDEYSGKQTLLSSFFGKKTAALASASPTTASATTRDENDTHAGAAAELVSSSASFSSTSTVLASQPQPPSQFQSSASSSHSKPNLLKRKSRSNSDADASSYLPTYEEAATHSPAPLSLASQVSSQSSRASSSASTPAVVKAPPKTPKTTKTTKASESANKKAKTGKTPAKGKSSTTASSSQSQPKLSSFFGGSSSASGSGSRSTAGTSSSTSKDGKKSTASLSRSNSRAERSNPPAVIDINDDDVDEVPDSEFELSVNDVILTNRPRRSDDEDASADGKRESERMRQQEEADYAYALALSKFDGEAATVVGTSSQSASSSSSSSSKDTKGKGKGGWGTILGAPLNPPRCAVHGEVTKQWTVNKAGPNKGKVFFLCSRPVGPGYDAGKSVRLREDVDTQYRCNFFKWAADVRKEQQAGASGGSSK